MRESDLYFEIGDKIRVEGREYVVEGVIKFYNETENYRWTEYKIKSMDLNSIRWLSIDNIYDEYAIYDEYRYSEIFKEDNIISLGYKEVDYGTATITDARGNLDVYIDDVVKFKEFEDSSEEKIIALEIWEDEIEYSKGHYLDKDEIKKLSRPIDYNQNVYSSFNHTNKKSSSKKNKSKFMVIGLIMAVIVILIIGFTKSNSISISKFIGENSNFTYDTSITSDVDTTQKADIYSTNLPIKTASNTIIDGIGGKVEDVQENAEDGTVAIMTKEEYCIIYMSDIGETLVQISSRLYAYSSNNPPYRSYHSTGMYYRNYYYTRGYTRDRSRYSSHRNSYENYSGYSDDEDITTNSNNNGKTYSNSVRQSSTGSRVSSGGGTSSGK